jgi:cystine transport system ATP-binding protein
MEPHVMLFDEPTSALDPELASEVVDVLSKLAKEGTTMVIATHDLRLASKIAKNVVFLESGNIVETGTAHEIFTKPKQERTKQFVATINAAHTYDI